MERRPGRPFSRDEFVGFLLAAKRSTYAGQGDDATVEAALAGSRQLEYEEGNCATRVVI